MPRIAGSPRPAADQRGSSGWMGGRIDAVRTGAQMCGRSRMMPVQTDPAYGAASTPRVDVRGNGMTRAPHSMKAGVSKSSGPSAALRAGCATMRVRPKRSTPIRFFVCFRGSDVVGFVVKTSTTKAPPARRTRGAEHPRVRRRATAVRFATYAPWGHSPRNAARSACKERQLSPSSCCSPQGGACDPRPSLCERFQLSRRREAG